MKYLGYILIAAAFYGGIAPWPIIIVPVCAVLSTLLYMSARRAEVRHKNYTGDRNMIVDGAYLIAIQSLIMFSAYLLGWLFMQQKDTIFAWLHLG